MSKRVTWSKPNGEWGVEDVDLTRLPPRAYGGLHKLKSMEDMIERINDPETPDWLAADLTAELLGRDT